MLNAIFPKDMRALEQTFMAQTRYPSLLLMEHAAGGLADYMAGTSGRVLFLCGYGQNGGDGYAAARLHGGKVTLWQFMKEQLAGDALLNADLLCALRPDVDVIAVGDTLPEIPGDTSLIVDALFGTGLSRPIEGIMAQAIERVNASGVPILSADIPSGIDAESGGIWGCAVRATATVTFHRPKIGLYLGKAVDYTGRIIPWDIGIPAHLDSALKIPILEPSDLPLLRPRRKRFSHKGDYGRVLVVAGRPGFAGAAAMCAQAAVKAGAGLVTIACDENIIPILQTLVPCAMCVPLPDFKDALSVADAVAIGPGLGTREERVPIMEAVIAADKPTVFDADALNLIAQCPSLRRAGLNAIYTPHPLEHQRLQNGKALDGFQGVLVLKGATTKITAPECYALNTVGTPALAKGGSGDVLTGIIAALLAQAPEDPFLCARLGCLMHGMAGLAAENALGENALDGMALTQFIPG